MDENPNVKVGDLAEIYGISVFVTKIANDEECLVSGQGVCGTKDMLVWTRLLTNVVTPFHLRKVAD